ncbi:hypothetical protein ACIQV3_08610 [Streptomyces sp. NPDC099050]|uniref:hypothetical protein n=1 Tax=Streptomyces sp. NPDC099050 TaxID=3366100 RepID=UPI00382FC12A
MGEQGGAGGGAQGGGKAAGGGGAGGARGGPGAGGAGGGDGRDFGAARSGPFGNRVGDGGYDAAQQARAHFFDVRGRNAVVDGAQGDVHLGDHHHYHGGRAAADRLVTGPVHRDELRRLRRVFEEPPGYGAARTRLEGQRLIALCGDPGSGRTYTALSLLDEVTRGRIERLDPRTELHRIDGSDLQAEHGYLVEITGEGMFLPGQRPADEDRHEDSYGGRYEGRYGDRVRFAEPPAELHLDRLSSLLERHGAYAILVVEAGGFADELLRGRYGTLFRPPSADGMLRKHLVALLGHGEAERLAAALALAERADTVAALGLDQLRPHEVESLARLLVDHLAGKLAEEELLAELRTFAVRQAEAWLAAPGRVPPRNRAAVAAATRLAAFRTTVAVFSGSPYSVAAEAAEGLAWEFEVTMDPARAPGRALFHEHQDARLAASRAELFTEDVNFGSRALGVRKVRLQGRALPWAVLSRAWEGYPNVRGPLGRWLRTLCDDGRPVAWVPAALTVGALCPRDLTFLFQEVVLPMASSDSTAQHLAAATALAYAAALDERVRPIVRDTVWAWARDEDDAGLRNTAALVHGYGTVERSVSASLDELGLLAGHDDEELLTHASYSVARLVVGSHGSKALARLGSWLGDRRRSRHDLALFTVDRLLWQQPSALWGLEDVPWLAQHQGRPVAAGLLTARPETAPMLADLVWAGLDTARWREEVESSLADWIRLADEDPGLLDVLCGFLPHLVSSPEDIERLRNLVRRLERDPDESVTGATTRRLHDAVPRTVIIPPGASGATS